MLGLNPKRETLYLNIEKRVEEMIENGLLDEVIMLQNLGYSKSNSVSQAIGYKELIKFLKKEMSFTEAVEEIKKNTRHLAKKQLTWFRADKRINWFDTPGETGFKALIKDILFTINSGVANERT